MLQDGCEALRVEKVIAGHASEELALPMGHDPWTLTIVTALIWSSIYRKRGKMIYILCSFKTHEHVSVLLY